MQSKNTKVQMSEKVFGYVQSLELAARYEYSQFGCSSILEGKTIGHAIHVRVQLYERSYSSVFGRDTQIRCDEH